MVRGPKIPVTERGRLCTILTRPGWPRPRPRPRALEHASGIQLVADMQAGRVARGPSRDRRQLAGRGRQVAAA